MEKKISVVVPVYNSEKYLSDLYKSIAYQTYKNYEIIFVDDGSTDQSLKILNTFKENDKKVKVVSKSNGGVSSARNRGLECCTGDYITFVDSDDFIDKDMFSIVMDYLNKDDYDILSSGYYLYNSSVDKKSMLNQYCGELTKEDALKDMFNNRLLGMTCCGKFFKKSIIKNLFFDEEIKNNEDRLFLFHAVYNSNSIFIIDKCLYYYRYNNCSYTNSGFKLSFLDSIKVAYKMKTKVLDDEDLVNYADASIIRTSLLVLKSIYLSNHIEQYFQERKKIINNLKTLKIVSKYKILGVKKVLQALMVIYFEKVYILLYKLVKGNDNNEKF